KKQGKRKKLLENCKLSAVHYTLIFYESPHRLIETLKDLQEIFGDIEIVLCRELTKIYEEIRREKISETIAYFEKTPPKGEFTLLFNFNIPLK
ncbi:MAG: putative S-adenosylmethionine-dependent methyltransferase, partial [Microgenomates group bacterium LiPW_31]